MMLKDFNFAGFEATKIRVLGYAKDGNTPQKHFYNASKIEKDPGRRKKHIRIYLPESEACPVIPISSFIS